MRRTLLVIAASVSVFFATVPVWAHHAFEAEYDSKKPVHLTGKVTEMEWINPHSWIHLDVTGPDGKVTSWMVECGSPNIMLRRGFTKRSLEAGTILDIQGYQAKSGDNKANGSSVTFQDGHRLFVGGSNPDDAESKRTPQQ
jgi:hypothetical protein